MSVQRQPLRFRLHLQRSPFRGFKDRNMDFSCTYSILDPNEICDNCFQAIHLINYEAYNICVEKVQKSIQAHLVPLHNDFQSMPFKPFFYLGNDRKVYVSPDNPLEPYTVNRLKVD